MYNFKLLLQMLSFVFPCLCFPWHTCKEKEIQYVQEPSTLKINMRVCVCAFSDEKSIPQKR